MVEPDTQNRLNAANAKLQKLQVEMIPVSRLIFLEKNAHYMPAETYKQLVANIKRDGVLSSVPFCIREGDKFRVLSGNHRARASVDAGLAEILILYPTQPLTADEQLAIQLSHNSLVGRDDLQILRELYAQIGDVDLKQYSGIDDKLLGQLPAPNLTKLSECGVDYQVIQIVFLPEEKERLAAVFKKVMEAVSADDVYLARLSDYDRLLDTLTATCEATGVKNTATALMLILTLVERHSDELGPPLMEST
jgi:hypothetical protein